MIGSHYHGILFSMIQGIPFAALGTSTKGLLTKYHTENRLVGSLAELQFLYSQPQEKIDIQPFDFNVIMEKVKTRKKKILYYTFNDQKIMFPPLPISRQIFLDILSLGESCLENPSQTDLMLLQFDKTILGRPLGSYLHFDLDVDTPKTHLKPWAGISRTGNVDQDISKCQLLLTYGYNNKTKLESNCGNAVPVVSIMPYIAMNTDCGDVINRIVSDSVTIYNFHLLKTRRAYLGSMECPQVDGPLSGLVTSIFSDVEQISELTDLADTDIVLVEDSTDLLFEMVSRNRVGVVKDNPFAREILKDYPGFYKTLNEAVELIQDSKKMVACKQHLKMLSKERFSMTSFLNSIQNSILSISH